jgi:hypothetical protein
MMKVIIKILLYLTLITGAATAAEVERLSKETTVNGLLKNGWIVQFVSNSNNIVTYTLLNTFSGEIATCKVLPNDTIKCFKP